MKVKVCGIRQKGNLDYLNSSAVDMIGFIFYQKSKRFFDGGNLSAEEMHQSKKEKVGVFVNASLDELLKTIKKYHLDGVQLHGEESPKYCLEAKKMKVSVMKAFSIADRLPDDLQNYEGAVDLFLFDTKGAAYGGNGIQFDWTLLESYHLDTPFMVSGGIGQDDVQKLKNIKNEKMIGVDINSRFEIEPGLKDEALVAQFIKEIKEQ